MTLKRKFLLRGLVPLVGLLLMGATSLWGLLSLRGDVHDALAGGEELNRVDGVRAKLASVRSTLPGTPDAARAAAATLGNTVLPRLRAAESGGWRVRDSNTKAYTVMVQKAVDTAVPQVERASALLRAAADDSGGADGEAAQRQAAATLDEARNGLSDVVEFCQRFIEQRNRAADDQTRLTLWVMAALFAGTLAVAGVSGLLQYRGVMVPLDRLRVGVRRVAAAQFTDKVDESGDREFADLAAEFNRMAVELLGFYRDLEEKVLAKSRELVRSERLASVGFLAAGVAHEINNPLSVISGYAELSSRRLQQASEKSVEKSAAAEVMRCLGIIRDEAFRCKEITEKLLSLTKGDTADRESLSMADVAREVAEMTRGLKNYRDRRLRLRFPADEPLTVMAQRTEMKQVLLNLTVNALEAVGPGDGEVCVEGRRTSDWVELKIKDNGRGMPAETLKQVFEPFFTAKRGAGAPGTGLGLSITHAIIENHGGRIRADSDGPGLGSQFTILLPAKADGADGAPVTAMPAIPTASAPITIPAKKGNT